MLGRPIILGCEGPTIRLSEYVDTYLKPLIQYIQSNVKDSTDFLKQIFKLNDTLPKDFILITIDVKHLYTNRGLTPPLITSTTMTLQGLTYK